jgi:hypothetical protein
MPETIEAPAKAKIPPHTTAAQIDRFNAAMGKKFMRKNRQRKDNEEVFFRPVNIFSRFNKPPDPCGTDEDLQNIHDYDGNPVMDGQKQRVGYWFTAVFVINECKIILVPGKMKGQMDEVEDPFNSFHCTCAEFLDKFERED